MMAMSNSNFVDTSPPGAGRRDALTLVSLAAVTWGFKLVGRTRMLTEAWRADGQPTVFVQVPSLRTAVERVLRPLRLVQSAAPVPIVRPWPIRPARLWSRLGADGVRRAVRPRARALRQQLARLIDFDRAVALVVSPVWTPWLDELPFATVVYDCIDELAVHVTRPDLAGMYRQWEDELLERADGAAVVAEGLGADLRQRRASLPVRVIRNGVDAGRFRELAGQCPRPVDVPARGRPIVGFIGALYEWIDWELIAATADSCPECDFVFVGPHDGRGDVERLTRRPNVTMLGPRAYEQVPAYVAAFDVCWVPFKQNDVAAAANPVKIYEYLALGRPVVTTPVADVDSFGSLIAVARSAEEMASALRGALMAPTDLAADRVRFAEENTWASRSREYVEFVGSLVPGGGSA